MVSESMRLSVYQGDEIRPRSKDYIDPSDKLSRTALMLRGSSLTGILKSVNGSIKSPISSCNL